MQYFNIFKFVVNNLKKKLDCILKFESYFLRVLHCFPKKNKNI